MSDRIWVWITIRFLVLGVGSNIMFGFRVTIRFTDLGCRVGYGSGGSSRVIRTGQFYQV